MQIPASLSLITAYNCAVAHELDIGDLIRKKRKSLGLSQGQLGMLAKPFTVTQEPKAIDPNTVGDVERQPYNSAFETVLRLLAALHVSLAEAEHAVGNPFLGFPKESTPGKDANARERDRLWKLVVANGAEGPVLETMRRYAGVTAHAQEDPLADRPVSPVTQAKAGRTHPRRKKL